MEFDYTREVKHIQREERDHHDPYGHGFIELRKDLLAQLLFTDIYAIDEMQVKDRVLILTVRYTGPATPRDHVRGLVWDTQQQDGDRGIVSFAVVPLLKQQETASSDEPKAATQAKEPPLDAKVLHSGKHYKGTLPFDRYDE